MRASTTSLTAPAASPPDLDRARNELSGADSSSFGDALAWLDRHINLEAIERGQAGRAAEPTLERIATLLGAMGDPERSYPSIHITGTNGKGSTTRIATALLLARGLSTGTIMSPHLQQINERITRDFVPIADEELLEILVALETLEDFVCSSGALSVPPTWFELVTAAAYRYFADCAVDVAVVEVGLGGRYDATNVIDAEVAVVTNVELDHVEILGPTRAHIAREKAGIIKSASIAVIGEEDDEIVEIFAAEAARVGARDLWRRGRDFSCSNNSVALGGRVLDIRTPGTNYEGLFLGLHGAHQGANASLALVAVEAFFGSPMHEDVVAEAFAKVKVPGRLEVLERSPLVIVDGAHNVAGATVLGQAMREDFASVGRIIVVMGCLRGRDPRALLTAMGCERVTEVICCEPASPRAQSAEAIAEAIGDLGPTVRIVPDVAEALHLARTQSRDTDAVLVTGSLYVVGAARGSIGRLASLGRE